MYLLVWDRIINHFSSRGISTKTLEDWAKTRMIRKRRRTVERNDRMLISQGMEPRWGKNNALDKFKLTKAISGETYRPGKGMDTKYMRSFQFKSCRWICELLVASCEHKEIDVILSRSASSRAELIRSIRTRVSPTELSDRVSHDILFWVKLLGDWPAITKGGLRYLLQCRVHFIQQMDVIKDQKSSRNGKVTLKCPDEDGLFYCLFGMNMEGLIWVNWNVPLDSDWLGLENMVSIQSRILYFDPKTTTGYRKIVELFF